MTTDATPPLAGRTGSAPDETDSAANFYGPPLILFVTASTFCALFGFGDSAVAFALLAHLTRSMAKDDKETQRRNADANPPNVEAQRPPR